MDLRQEEVPGWKANRSKDDIIDLRQQEVVGWADAGPEGPRKIPEVSGDENRGENVVDFQQKKLERQLAVDDEVMGLQARVEVYTRKVALYKEQGMDLRKQEYEENLLKETQEKLRTAQMKATG